MRCNDGLSPRNEHRSRVTRSGCGLSVPIVRSGRRAPQTLSWRLAVEPFQHSSVGSRRPGFLVSLLSRFLCLTFKFQHLMCCRCTKLSNHALGNSILAPMRLAHRLHVFALIGTLFFINHLSEHTSTAVVVFLRRGGTQSARCAPARISCREACASRACRKGYPGGIYFRS